MAIIDLKKTRKCEGGFLADYVVYADYLEGPPDFNLWVGISLVGMALGRRCFVKLGFDNVYPNTYLVLTGPSAVGKGMAMNAGKRVLVDAIGYNGVPMIAQKTTPEALVEHLKEITEEDADRGALIWSPEFSNLIGKSKQDQSLIQDLTDYYDCLDRKVYRTRSHGEEVLQNLCVNMLAASTPEWLKSSIPEDSIGGGFLSRLLIVNRLHRVRREARPEVKSWHISALENCTNDLAIINKLKGEFTLEPSAFRLFSDWYEEYLDVEIEEAGSNLESYYERKKLLVLKLGMIFSACTGDDMIIHEQDIFFALDKLRDNEKYLKLVVRHMGLTDSGKRINKIRKLVKRHGVINRSKLLQSIDLTAEEVTPIIDTLIETGEVRLTLVGNRNRRVYEWIEDKERLDADEKKQQEKEGEVEDDVR